MRNIAKKVLSILLVLVVCFSLPNVVIAADTPLKAVHAFSDADNQHHLLTLLELNDTAYIKASDALQLSGYDDYKEENGKVIFEYGKHIVEFKNGQKEYDGVFYYPLRLLMDALSTRYHYEETTDTLIFLTCDTYYENLLEDCESVFLDDYTLDFYEGTGWQVAGVYEILGGMRFDALWGGYQRELYEEAVAGIIAEEDISSLSTIKQGDSIMSKLSKVLSFVEKDIDGIKTYEEFLGTDLDGVIKAYSQLNKLIPGISVKNAIEILEYVENSSANAELYSNAVKYGLVDNEYVTDENLSYATELVYAYYDENKPTYEAVIQSLVDDVQKDILDKIPVEKITVELIKEAVGYEVGGIYINAAYVKLAKLIFDELGMKERSTAVMQTVACRNIQEVAIDQFINSRSLSSYVTLDGYAAQKERAKTIKYTTILYLRACQYAYSLYEFDDTLNFATEYWSSKTESAISTISAYSDDELALSVINEELELTSVKTYEAQDEYAFIPSMLRVKDWNSGADDTCPSISFKEDMSCELSFNMAEWMLDCIASYEVFLCKDGTKLIKVELGDTVIGDGKSHKTTWFYLIETENGEWSYYGEDIGFTYFETVYSAINEQQILISYAEVLSEASNFEGQYQWTEGEIFDILTLRESESGSVSFDASWYRTADIDKAQGKMYGNLVPFRYKYYHEGLNEYFYETTGLIAIVGETAVLTIFDTSLPYIEIGSYTYQKQDPVSVDNSIFDGTYWWLTFGQTIGSNYVAKFYKDGTFSAVSMASGSVSTGTYDYYMGTLVINLDPYYNVYFNKKGSDFVSVEEYPFQVGSGHYTISPDSNAIYEDYIE